MTPAEAPAKTAMRVTVGNAAIPTGAYAERYASSLVWSHGRQHGTRQVSRCTGIEVDVCANTLRVRAGVYRLKAAACDARIS